MIIFFRVFFTGSFILIKYTVQIVGRSYYQKYLILVVAADEYKQWMPSQVPDTSTDVRTRMGSQQGGWWYPDKWSLRYSTQDPLVARCL